MVGMRLIYLLAASAAFAQCQAIASISSTMIVEMREITSVSVSPDGHLTVVGVCHSNPRTNSRETSWVVVPLHEGGMLKIISAGAEIYDPSGSGALLTQQALWSGDSKSFFYLRREGEEVQLWETSADGRTTRQVTHSASDLIDLKRSSVPDEFIVTLAPDRASLRKAEEDEHRNGILYDDHIIGGLPLTRTFPIIDRWRSVRWHSVTGSDTGEFVSLGWSKPTNAIFDVRLGKLKTSEETIPATFAAAASESQLGRVTVIALSPIPKITYDYDGQYTLQLQLKTRWNPIQKCDVAACIANRISIIGWSPDSAEIYYLADSLQGPLGSYFPGGAAIYAWNPRANVVRLIHDTGTEGLWGRLYNLGGPGGLSFEPSPSAGREIVAVFAGADQPPRLEAINLDTGTSRILYDPNAELRSLTQGRAAWHTWTTSTGYPGRGIMILPDHFRPGEKYPAVITTYGCGNGFLRGGSGDNAPEFVLAHQGFIAICVDAAVTHIIARETALGHDLSRLYSIMCDIVSGFIADQTKDGKLDPTRVGLTGQSLGANAGIYCVSHSNAITAAAFRHGSSPERSRWDLFHTNAWERGPDSIYARLQLPDPSNDPTGRWDKMSASHRAREINTPTLIQIDDEEYLSALPLWSAMREEGKPVEMYVFPDDTHMLMQPIHMLVNFERQLDWFEFWLKHEEDAEPSKRDQYDRWNRLRELIHNSPSQH
jgi:dipeptidyl aminopeptidase/acylaminoacyl peptidase